MVALAICTNAWLYLMEAALAKSRGELTPAEYPGVEEATGAGAWTSRIERGEPPPGRGEMLSAAGMSAAARTLEMVLLA